MTLHVGGEVLTAAPQKVEGGNQLFTRHKGSNLECHGLVRKKLVLQPASIKSSTHKALTKRIAKNHVKGSRMQLHTTTVDPEKKKLDDEKTWEQKNRLQARQSARAGQQLRRPGRRDEGSDSSEEREESEEDGNSEEMDDFIVKDDGVEASESEEEEAEESDDSEEEAKAPKKRGRK